MSDLTFLGSQEESMSDLTFLSSQEEESITAQLVTNSAGDTAPFLKKHAVRFYFFIKVPFLNNTFRSLVAY
jgi:hypothetical protein